MHYNIYTLTATKYIYGLPHPTEEFIHEKLSASQCLCYRNFYINNDYCVKTCNKKVDRSLYSAIIK